MTEAERSSSRREARTGGELRLLDAFRELHAESMRAVTAAQGAEPPDSEAVKQRLLGLLARQFEAAKSHFSEHELSEFDAAQYVMVAMADEVFLHLAWAGRDPWAARPLEEESRFGTHVAGERFYQKLDAILAGNPSVSSELLAVYLAALSLGFRGRYRYDPRSTEPERYRREIIKHLRRVEPRMLAQAAEVCPEALEHTRDRQVRRGLSNLREGVLPLVGVIGALLLIGHGLWFYRTSDVRSGLDRVEENDRKADEALVNLRKHRKEQDRERHEPAPKPAESPDGGTP